MTDVPKKQLIPRDSKTALPDFPMLGRAENQPREPRFQLSDPLLDCVLVASFSAPPELQCITSLTTGPIRIGVEVAEAQVKYLRACVPQLKNYTDIEVLRLSAQAAREYADELAIRLPEETRQFLAAWVQRHCQPAGKEET